MIPSKPIEPIKIEYTLEFKRNLRTLAKKYQHIRFDVQPLIDRLQAGEVVGERVPGTNYTIYKVRVQNSDIGRGKRSGYRVIYHIKTPAIIILVTIYSKLAQADITPKQIKHILKEFNEHFT